MLIRKVQVYFKLLDNNLPMRVSPRRKVPPRRKAPVKVPPTVQS